MILEMKPFDSITAEDILSLINTVAESHTIEYKSELPGTTVSDKKEFLADISAFANSSGGFLVFGMHEKDGYATGMSGLQIENADGLILQLESMVRDGLDPRIPKVRTRCIPGVDGSQVVIMRVPSSPGAPHMVNFQGHGRFYVRGSRGKHPMDVSELRAAFRNYEATEDAISSFYNQRVSLISKGETPVLTQEGPKVILHLIPFAISDSSFSCDFDVARKQLGRFVPLYTWDGCSPAYSSDGFTMFVAPEPAASYVHLFRNGAIEAVSSVVFVQKQIASLTFEDGLIKGLDNYIHVQRALGLESAFKVAVTLTGVEGYSMAADMRIIIAYGLSEVLGGNQMYIRKDRLIVPPVVVTGNDQEPNTILRPIFDHIWNASGWRSSPYYDDAGRRKGY